jgi:hypothetical protein
MFRVEKFGGNYRNLSEWKNSGVNYHNKSSHVLRNDVLYVQLCSEFTTQLHVQCGIHDVTGVLVVIIDKSTKDVSVVSVFILVVYRNDWSLS